ncbi:MAG: Ribosomal large subunit pseudouridine synthase C [Planctomycetes bacterium]|nr:Ribosomal large subunit pseudouridine synthase C [Planctomycetota bacterium]
MRRTRISDYESRGGGDAWEDEGAPDRAARRPAKTEILLDDPRFVVVAKPSGLPSVPERFRPDAETVVDAAHELLRRADPRAPRPLIVHRLDRETSGVMVLAKDESAARELSQAFEEHRVSKTYVALTTGAPQPPSGEVTFLVAEDPRRPGAMTLAQKAVRGTKECTSAWETLETFRGVSLVRVRPRTGRTHQVRLTLKHLGTPCAVDALYGSGDPLLLSQWKRDYRTGRYRNEVPLIERLTLHAESLEFPRPGAETGVEAGAAGAVVRAEAPLPRDFAAALKQLRRWAAPGTL